MGRTVQLANEFEKRNTKPLGLSTDTAEEHRKWIADINDTQNTDLQFPIVADADCRIAKLYDMIHPEQSETAAVRSVFTIDPKKENPAYNDIPNERWAQFRRNSSRN